MSIVLLQLQLLKNTNNTESDSSDDYYQLAVKSTNIYSSDVYGNSGDTTTDINWSIYAIDSTGDINWEKTTYSQTIQSFEVLFNQDLDGDGDKGIDYSALEKVSTDTYGWQLYKDSNKSLFGSTFKDKIALAAQ